MATISTSDSTRKKVTRRGFVLAAGAALSLAAVFAALALPSLGGQGAYSTGNIRQSETEAGNLVADAVRAAASADVAFVPAAAFKPGATAPRPATPEQAAGLVDPATDVIVVLSLQGKQIADALERSVSFAPQPSSGFLQVSGLKFTYDPSKPSGRRLVSVSVGGTAMDAVKTYKVATTRPLANGQQGYFKIWEKDQITGDTGKTLATALADFARSRGGSLSVALESRIVAN